MLTLDFGAAEEGLAEYIEPLFSIVASISKVDEGVHLSERIKNLKFSGKVKVFRTLVQVLADQYSIDGADVLRRLDTVNELAEYRNAIIHGWVTVDKQGRPAFRNKRKVFRSATATDIGRLCKRIEQWFDDMRDSYLGFLDQVRARIRPNFQAGPPQGRGV